MNQVQQQEKSTDNRSNLAADGRKLLTFTLRDEEYGIDLLRIQEIKGYLPITPIPNTPEYIKGVINLRGSVIPVMSLRRRFGMEEAEYNKFTVIIVINVESKVVGLLVDGVSDVLSVPTEDIQSPPEIVSSIDTAFLSGLVRKEERLVLLLNLEPLIGATELASTSEEDA